MNFRHTILNLYGYHIFLFYATSFPSYFRRYATGSYIPVPNADVFCYKTTRYNGINPVPHLLLYHTPCDISAPFLMLQKSFPCRNYRMVIPVCSYFLLSHVPAGFSDNFYWHTDIHGHCGISILLLFLSSGWHFPVPLLPTLYLFSY